jgi:REP element-mobilizing transposase RayT
LRQTRKKIRLSPTSYQQGHAFFITVSTHIRFPWFSAHAELAEGAVQLLMQLALDRASKLYAWCVMPDHIHLLLQDRNIIDFVRLFKGKLVPKASALKRDQRLWQRSFYDHGLRKDEALEQTAAYIWENPVRAGLVNQASEYEWSGSLVWANSREFRGRV